MTEHTADKVGAMCEGAMCECRKAAYMRDFEVRKKSVVTREKIAPA